LNGAQPARSDGSVSQFWEGKAMSIRQKLVSRIFAISLAFAPLAALGQQYMPVPPRSVVGNMTFQTNPGSVVTLAELIAAFGSSVQLDQMTKIGDANYAISPNDRIVATLLPRSLPREPGRYRPRTP
jgi:hypothetical protein